MLFLSVSKTHICRVKSAANSRHSWLLLLLLFIPDPPTPPPQEKGCGQFDTSQYLLGTTVFFWGEKLRQYLVTRFLQT